MLSLKSSLFAAVLAFSFSSHAEVTKFSSKECLMADYETKVEHKGDYWGLLKSELIVKKDVCQIRVLDKGMLDNEWKIDVCREPIHIKSISKGSLSVHKRKGECSKASTSEFCASWNKLKASLEDKGLIFAEGERERLSDSHGKIYCAYLLLKKHLDEGVLFSKYQDPVDIYTNGLEEKTEAAKSQAKKKENKTDSKKVEAQGRF